MRLNTTQAQYVSVNSCKTTKLLANYTSLDFSLQPDKKVDN